MRVKTNMIIVEQQHYQEAKRQSHKLPPDIQVPGVNHPISVLRRWESPGYGHALQPCILQSPGEM
jgi:hypothetical protein